MGSFKEMQMKIALFNASAREQLAHEVEEWYKNNIRLGGTQSAKGIVGKKYHRKHSYSHPVLQETKQLVNSIKAKYYSQSVHVSHKTFNYRGGKTMADYGKIQNERYGFMKPSEALSRHVSQMLGRRIKNIFQ